MDTDTSTTRESTQLAGFIDRLERLLDGMPGVDVDGIARVRPSTRERELRELNIAIGRLLSFRTEIQQHVDAA